jgi:hypothetical protein
MHGKKDATILITMRIRARLVSLGDLLMNRPEPPATDRPRNSFLEENLSISVSETAFTVSAKAQMPLPTQRQMRRAES